ncbi:MAG: DMT family transporter [Oceanospirillaceae bacterium]|jgi:drug/metabolite transporter (DMT)-like permease|nr:DMT family transporter [Oceanospirillaceae bacterium]MBT4444187.1 DMT family transporter [Oceanospirillaceae bacterium]MBT6077722.1 DMT family transporter [Oceanospirillaceae bacterium]
MSITLPAPFVRLMPFVFVWVWSTGFLVAKLGRPFAEPFTLLSYRFALALLVLWLIIKLMASQWPSTWRLVLHCMLVGLLFHGVYLGGIFQAVSMGMPAGLSAMVIGLQPLTMALFAGLMLGETVSKRQWLGLVMGLMGLYLVLGEQFALDPGTIFDGFSGWAPVLVGGALVGISFGTLYQKRYCHGVDHLTSIWFQYASALVFSLVIAFTFETRKVDWQWQFIASLTWQVLALSIGAVLLLMIMMRQGAATKVGSFFYLVPPAVALQAWFLFGEAIGWQGLAGVTLIATGVAQAVWPKS